jgi:hypothetical protein
MSSSPRLVGQSVHAPGSSRTAPELAWGLLGSAGVAFSAIALADLTLALLPFRFGDSGWEFGSTAAILGGMPLLAVGLVLGYASSVSRSRRVALRTWSSLMIGVAALLLLAFGTYLVRLPDAYAAAAPGPMRQELLKTVIRTICQGVVYPTLLCWLGVRGWVLASED